MQKINVATIGGGTGTFNVLYGLKNNPRLHLSAIVNVADSGGSTGILRDEFGILPPGDIRRAIVAMSEDTGMVRKLFEYRFKKESSVSGHTVGNLLLTALADITGSFEGGIQELSEMFDVRGRVIPVTLGDIQLAVELADGSTIVGETNIDIPKHDGDLAIRRAYLIGDSTLNPRARETILNADYIVIGPGDTYTSIIANLLSDGMHEAIAGSSARVIYVCNIMTKHGETTNFEVADFIRVIEEYIGEGRIDYVIVNNGYIRDDLIERYRSEEHKKPVKIKDPSLFTGKHYKIIERNLVNENDYIRHDPEKLRGVIEDIFEGWIK